MIMPSNMYKCTSMIPATSFYNITRVAHIFASMPPDSQATQSKNILKEMSSIPSPSDQLCQYSEVTCETPFQYISMLLLIDLIVGINQSTSTWIWKCTEPQMCHRGRSQFLVVPGRYPNGISCWKMATCEFPKAALTQHTRLLSSQSKEQHSLRFYM